MASLAIFLFLFSVPLFFPSLSPFREGPFSCHPDLLCHFHSTSQSRSPQEGNPSSADWDNAPPLLHMADEDRLPLDTTSSDSGEEEDEEEEEMEESIALDSVTEEWEEVEDCIRTPSFGLGDRLEYGQVYRDYGGGRGPHSSQRREREETVQSSSGLLEALGSLLGSGFRSKGL